MPANAAIYMPYEKLNMGRAELCQPDGRNGNSPHYQDTVSGAAVRLNVMPTDELSRHLKGFAGWVRSLQDAADRMAAAETLITHTKTVLGLVTETDFEATPELWAWLFKVADQNDGVLFLLNSIYLANGAVLVGAMRNQRK